MPPFLEILTRCYKRPAMLRHNRASVEMLGPLVRQTFLVDTFGRGVGWSYTNMAAHAHKLEGLYIWILDDDDVCIRPTLIDELMDIAANHNPDVVMVRMDHGKRGILPSTSWGKRPVQGDIGCSAYITKRAVWQAHAKYFSAVYAGDFTFIDSIFDRDYEIYWHDVIASAVQRISVGKPEQRNYYASRI